VQEGSRFSKHMNMCPANIKKLQACMDASNCTEETLIPQQQLLGYQ